ncbi:hypothetical protein RRG08_030513 [Elysia crispata]|uniref:Uncharacterized protein n=1 Tax=Elysia crispata TaxID=231223 RepID=A0AAE1ANV7_9GAST|nr:hypothetical protein RRG08_030513 [Elysia crispata]
MCRGDSGHAVSTPFNKKTRNETRNTVVIPSATLHIRLVLTVSEWTLQRVVLRHFRLDPTIQGTGVTSNNSSTDRPRVASTTASGASGACGRPPSSCVCTRVTPLQRWLQPYGHSRWQEVPSLGRQVDYYSSELDLEYLAPVEWGRVIGSPQWEKRFQWAGRSQRQEPLPACLYRLYYVTGCIARRTATIQAEIPSEDLQSNLTITETLS